MAKELVIGGFVKGHRERGEEIWKNFESDTEARELFASLKKRGVYEGLRMFKR